MPTVRDAALRVLAAHGLTRMHANPGSTEVPLLARLPEPFTLVLGLHEGTVVGVATGDAVRTSLVVVVSVTLLVSLAIYGRGGGFNLAG